MYIVLFILFIIILAVVLYLIISLIPNLKKEEEEEEIIPINTRNIPYNKEDWNANVKIKQSHQNGSVPLDIKICEENLLLFNKIMKECGIFYWLSEGTALGVIRENRILPWDDDVDVSFFDEFRSKFINEALPILKLNGFVVGGSFHNGNLIALQRKNEKLDIDIVEKDGLCTAANTKNANTTSCNDIIPYLNDIRQISFLNTIFNVPGTNYLEFLYGKDWNVPKKTK